MKAPTGTPHRLRASAPASSVNAGTALEHSPLPPGARDYWAFKLPVQAPVPMAAAHLTNPIDRFLEKTRASKGLKAAPRADRLTLLRRAYLDLIGLPPTPDQTAAFLADTAPGSWERLIDTLLASPHYGERWARHWLDAARYADTTATKTTSDRPNIWRYRDYVIRSLNSDKPYNVFLTEQVAGDELDNRTTDSYIATAFLRLGPRVGVREGDNPQYRFDYLDDMIATIGKGTLGLTLQCARCHNHKFDPILQRDYYALQASLFGYVETSYPLAPKEQVDAYNRKVAEIDAKQARCAPRSGRSKRRTGSRLRAEAIKRDFPLNVQQAVAKPEAERTEGEKLLADQVLKSAVINVKVDEAMTPEDLARRKALDAQIDAARRGVARAVAGGRHRDRRRLPLLPGSGDRGDGGGRQPRGAPGATQRELPAHGSRPLRSAALVFPDSRRHEREGRPDAAWLRHGGHLWQSGHRDSSTRRPHLRPPARAGSVADLARRIRCPPASW